MDTSFLDSIAGRYGDSYLSEFTALIARFAPGAQAFLEWGSGETTAALCALAQGKPAPYVLSIDHVLDYSLSVARGLTQYPFLHMRVLDLQGPSRDQRDREASYSSYPFMLGQRFDVVFVDGRRRAECALVAAQVVTQQGIVLVHDYRRERYKTMLALFDVLHEGEQFLVLRSRIAPPLTTPARQERRLIAVPVQGLSAEREFSVTRPFFEAYAAAVGADLRTFGLEEGLEPARLKAGVRRLVADYDRVLLMDADILIRPEAPDLFAITPPGMIGVFPEGGSLPRADYVSAVNSAYQLDPPLSEHRYFNAGVMLFSREHLPVFESLAQDVLYAHPQYEQGKLNAEVQRRQLPIFPFPPDFNFLPVAPYTAQDWAYAFFYHPAGALPHDPRHMAVWQDQTGERRIFRQAVYLPSRRRHLFLRALADRINGLDTRYFDMSDLYCLSDRAMPLLEKDGTLLVTFPDKPADVGDGLALFGPYCDLEAGDWVLDFITQQGTLFAYPGASLDVVSGNGTHSLMAATPWPEDGRFRLHLEAPASHCEFRIYRAQQAAEFLYLRVERVAAADQSVS